MEASPAVSDRAVFRRLPREQLWLEYVRAAAAGDESAFTALYDETSPLVYGLAMRMLANVQDAEEVTLDVYGQVWRTARTFSEDRGTVTAWLMTLARSRSLDRIRSRASRQGPLEPLPEQFELPSLSADPEEVSAAAQQRQIVLNALNQLPPEQRRALELAYFHGFSHSELAERLGEPLGTVKTRIRLGMLKLRELLTIATMTSGEGASA